MNREKKQNHAKKYKISNYVFLRIYPIILVLMGAIPTVHSDQFILQ